MLHRSRDDYWADVPCNGSGGSDPESDLRSTFNQGYAAAIRQGQGREYLNYYRQFPRFAGMVAAVERQQALGR